METIRCKGTAVQEEVATQLLANGYAQVAAVHAVHWAGWGNDPVEYSALQPGQFRKWEFRVEGAGPMSEYHYAVELARRPDDAQIYEVTPTPCE
jgi:hypothetical protein